VIVVAEARPDTDRGHVKSIAERQLDPQMIDVQKAAAVVHRRVQTFEGSRTLVALALAALGVVSILVPRLSQFAAVSGFVWTLVLAAIVGPVLRRQLRQAVVLQEMFDTQVFRLPWNSGLSDEPVLHAEVRRLARRLRSGGKRERSILLGWYDTTGDLAYPLDVLVCQEQNVGWDLRLRDRYRLLVGVLLTLWITAGAAVGILGNLVLEQLLLSWYFPSLPALAIGCEVFADQTEIVAQKRRLTHVLGRILGDRSDKPAAERDSRQTVQAARQVQDGIFVCRLLTPRVPNLVYSLFKNRDETDFGHQTALRVTELTR
jgi:hypothetical protein